MERRVVITGYGVINDLGKSKEEIRKNLFDGVSGLSSVNMEAVDGLTEGKFGAITNLTEVDPFFEEHNIPYDRCTQLALMAAHECIEQSGICWDDPYRAGVSIGTSLGGMLSGDEYHKQWIHDGYKSANGDLLKQYPLHAVADALSLCFGLCGCKNVISTACAASGNSIGYGFDKIKSGDQDVVLAGGVDPLSRFSFSGFTSLKAIDHDYCHPYSTSTGINLGEGAAFFMLEEYEHAVKRGANIIAEFYGCGLSGDAHHQTAPDPRGGGAIRSMRAALSQSGLSPEDISYVNGHGTGTHANDIAEPVAFKEVFGANPSIPLSSTKGATGHCLGAAGSVECAFLLMALEDQMVPPTVRFDKEPDPVIDFVPNKAKSAKLDMILSNSFAFGGNNCSIIVGKSGLYPPKPVEEDEIVITGIGCVGVGGGNVSQLFETFDAQKICTGTIEEFDTSEYDCKYSGIVPEVEYKRFVPPAFLRRTDTITKMTMAAGRQALDDAKLAVTRQNMDSIGIIYGTGTGPMETIESINRTIVEKGINSVDPSTFPNSVLNAAPGNLSIVNQLRGPISAITLAQTSGLIAVEYAAQILKNQQAEAIVAVCADEFNEPLLMGHDKLNLVSKSGKIAGAKDADGMILSAGSVAFMLERKSHAKARNAKIYAEIKGTAVCSDASEITHVKTDGAAFVKSAKLAMERAKTDSCDLIFSASTGVPEMDAADANAMKELVGEKTYVSNIQSLIGSTTGSIGCYQMLAALYSFEKGKVIDMPEGDYEIAEGLSGMLNKGANRSADIKTACVNAIGFGGTYASIVLAKPED